MDTTISSLLFSYLPPCLRICSVSIFVGGATAKSCSLGLFRLDAAINLTNFTVPGFELLYLLGRS